MTAEARRPIQAHIHANPRDKEDPIIYGVHKDLGAEPAKLSTPFGFYLDRFNLREEVQ